MAAIDVQNILNAYTQGANIANARRAQDLEQQRIQNEVQRTQNEHEFQQGQLKLTELQRQMAAAQLAQKIAEGIQTGGPVPQNATITPQEESSLNTTTIPVAGQNYSYTTRSPMDYATLQGQMGLESQAPALKKQQELQEEMLQRQMQLEQLRQSREDARNDVSNKARLEEERMRQAGANYRENLRYGPGGDFDPSPYVMPAAIGRYSDKDINSMPGMTPGQKKAITNMMTQSNYKFLNGDDQKFLNNASVATGLVAKMDQYNKMYDTISSADLINPYSTAHQNLSKLADDINKNIITTAQILAGTGRNNTYLMKALNGAYGVTMWPGKSDSNKAAANNWALDIQRIMDDRLAGLSEGQRALIYNDRGLGMGTHATIKMKFPGGQVVDVPLMEELDALRKGGQRVTANAK